MVPVETLHLFPILDRMLIELLRSLSPEDWQKPTVAKLWTIKDVAAHLLDGNVRAIAAYDGYEPTTDVQIKSYSDLVQFLNKLNADWVTAMKRVSPSLLIDQLVSTGKRHTRYMQSLEPFAVAKYSVAWAGEETSLNWFHIAREYTEKWHHQQQIRDAVGDSTLLTHELFYPCVDTFMYALPYNYRDVKAEEGTTIRFTITGEAGGDWYLEMEKGRWVLAKAINANSATSITLSPDTAWRLFTKAITSEEARINATVAGDQQLATAFFITVAVMA